MAIPANKASLLEHAEKEVMEVSQQYVDGLITEGERYNKVIDIWARLTDRVANEIQLFAGERNLHDDRPWLALPRDLAPGESFAWEVELRRPLGPARLLFKPSVLELEGHRPLRAATPWDRAASRSAFSAGTASE